MFSPKQRSLIRDSTARLNIAEGAVRSGKTFSSLFAWLRFLAAAPPGELLMIGKTERTLKRNVLDPLIQIAGDRDARLVQGSGEFHLFGRRIYLAGANDERAEGKIRGLTLAGAYGDEVTLWPESFFSMLLSRLSVPGARLIATTNPDSPRHWLVERYLDRAEELGIRRWRFLLEDNLTLDPAFVEALKREYTGVWYRRYILGEWCIAEGAIWDTWDEVVHVVSEIPARRRLYAAVDYGTNNPTVFLLVSEGRDRRWCVEREYSWDGREKQRQKTDSEYADDLVAFLGDERPEAIFVDPSAASFAAECRKRKLPVAPANNSVLEGIRTVGTLMASGRLMVHEGCSLLRREIPGYVWDPKAQARGEDAPVKANDHACDALRYALYSVLAPRGGRVTVPMRR